jgi:catechol-2,3-dioxygenase
MHRAERPIDPNLRIGHVHLRTADIDRVREFYVGILGFDVVHEARDRPGWGTTGAFRFTLPVEQQPRVESSQSSRPPTSARP